MSGCRPPLSNELPVAPPEVVSALEQGALLAPNLGGGHAWDAELFRRAVQQVSPLLTGEDIQREHLSPDDKLLVDLISCGLAHGTPEERVARMQVFLEEAFLSAPDTAAQQQEDPQSTPRRRIFRNDAEMSAAVRAGFSAETSTERAPRRSEAVAENTPTELRIPRRISLLQEYIASRAVQWSESSRPLSLPRDEGATVAPFQLGERDAELDAFIAAGERQAQRMLLAASLTAAFSAFGAHQSATSATSAPAAAATQGGAPVGGSGEVAPNPSIATPSPPSPSPSTPPTASPSVPQSAAASGALKPASSIPPVAADTPSIEFSPLQPEGRRSATTQQFVGEVFPDSSITQRQVVAAELEDLRLTPDHFQGKRAVADTLGGGTELYWQGEVDGELRTAKLWRSGEDLKWAVSTRTPQGEILSGTVKHPAGGLGRALEGATEASVQLVPSSYRTLTIAPNGRAFGLSTEASLASAGLSGPFGEAYPREGGWVGRLTLSGPTAEVSGRYLSSADSCPPGMFAQVIQKKYEASFGARLGVAAGIKMRGGIPTPRLEPPLYADLWGVIPEQRRLWCIPE